MLVPHNNACDMTVFFTKYTYSLYIYTYVYVQYFYDRVDAATFTGTL